jgi:hypothetical protein
MRLLKIVIGVYTNIILNTYTSCKIANTLFAKIVFIKSFLKEFKEKLNVRLKIVNKS